jgi:Na+/proline symporter
MSFVDWAVLLGTLGFIVGYGTWKTRKSSTRESYMRGGADSRWWSVGLSVMATQASAITFLSTPGQGYSDGMGFVQFYFGLPLAMLVIGAVFIPLFYKWKVYTAYEFIGRRFDGRVRLLTAVLFLIQRSMGAGITIYAPSIILAKVLHWPLSGTCIFIGALVILYTTTGGARAVGVTHMHQMAVMILGIVTAFGLIVHHLSNELTFSESLHVANALGKLDVIDLSWNPRDKYTLWSGLIGGFFLQLSYFGTDQSQVQRYLTGQSVAQARQGLWMNGVLKIPMQFFILLTGVLVFVFYLFHATPLHWNEANLTAARARDDTSLVRELETSHVALMERRGQLAEELVGSWRRGDAASAETSLADLKRVEAGDADLQRQFKHRLHELDPKAEANDTDYVFITFIMEHLPIGIIGLLLAMIFCAGMSSTSAELSALATTSTIDVLRPKRSDQDPKRSDQDPKRSDQDPERSDQSSDRSDQHSDRSEQSDVRITKIATVVFGLIALGFAALFSLFANLIQAVNVIGSLFYGTILGIFLVAFFIRRVHGPAVFFAALTAQATILALHFTGVEIAFLWYNLIAPAIVVVLAIAMQALLGRARAA